MKTSIAILILLALTGCHRNPDPKQWEHTTKSLEGVEGLEDCVFHRLDQSYVIVRCPNSTVSTTYSVGKSRITTNTISN